MRSARPPRIRRLATATAVVGLANVATIILMYTVAGFFGPVNDVGNGTEGVLLAVLAWRLAPVARSSSPHLARAWVMAATTGATVVVLGSLLVLSGRTGWFLAGHVTMLGYAILGAGVLGINGIAQRGGWWPQPVTTLGRLAGLAMLCGGFAIPAILNGLDDPRHTPWFVIVSYGGGVGWFLLAPVWSWRLGRLPDWADGAMSAAQNP
jgi:hypothetical protein